MVPPRSTDITKPLEGARLLKKSKVDAINIPDGPRASARMTGLALSVLMQKQVDIETVLHYTCRDRNLLGMQSDLLGATALGIRNILAITGDPPMIGDYPQATAVFDIDSIGLVHLIDNLNHGIDVGEKANPCDYSLVYGRNLSQGCRYEVSRPASKAFPPFRSTSIPANVEA